MAKILVNSKGKALMSADGKVYKGISKEIEVIPEGYIKPSGKIEITTTDEIDVSQYEKAQVIDANLEAENIKSGVNILGVTGTFEGGSNEDLLTAIQNNTLKSYNNSVITKIIGEQFQHCTNLESINLPNVKSTGSNSFYNCQGLKNVSLPNVTKLGYASFQYCSNLESINIPLITSIESQAFSYCDKLTNVNTPLVKSIGSSAFRNCIALTSVDFPNVTSISSQAFQFCSALTDIYLGANQLVTLSNKSAFNDVTTGLKVHVRSEYADQYASATNWSSLIESGTIVIVGDYSD